MLLLQSQEEVGVPVPSSRFSASEVGLSPAQGMDSLSRYGSSPNLVTNLSCDFVWVFPLWEPQSPIPKARDKLQRICCLQGWGNPSWLERSLSSFQPLLQGSPGLEPHILFLYPSIRNHLHSYPTSCLALDPEPPGSFYHVDSMTTGALIIPRHR